MLVIPGNITAATTGNSNKVDSSSYHSTPYVPQGSPSSPLSSPTPAAIAPSTTNQDGGSDFTTQAALSGVWARQTNNIVGAQSYYDVIFVTSTTGTIKFIDITFPVGTLIGASPRLVEREGIGAGNAVQSSTTTISYTVLSPVSVPAGTKIRLEFFNLVNPTLPSTGYKVTVITRNGGGTIIDGPTLSNSLNIKQLGTEQIADSAITGNKIAGIQKLLFAQCTIPTGSGSLPAGGTASVTCSVPGAEDGEDGVVALNGFTGGSVSTILITVGIRVSHDSADVTLRNIGSSPVLLDTQQLSIIVFRK